MARGISLTRGMRVGQRWRAQQGDDALVITRAASSVVWARRVLVDGAEPVLGVEARYGAVRLRRYFEIEE